MIRISLSELKTFRVVCKACGKGVVELPIANLDLALGRNDDCKFCGHVIFQRSGPTPLVQLGKAIESILAVNKVLDVEVEVPEP